MRTGKGRSSPGTLRFFLPVPGRVQAWLPSMVRGLGPGKHLLEALKVALSLLFFLYKKALGS